MPRPTRIEALAAIIFSLSLVLAGFGVVALARDVAEADARARDRAERAFRALRGAVADRLQSLFEPEAPGITLLADAEGRLRGIAPVSSARPVEPAAMADFEELERRADQAIALGRLGEAAALLSPFLRERAGRPEAAPALALAAAIARQRGQASEARRLYLQLIAEHPAARDPAGLSRARIARIFLAELALPRAPASAGGELLALFEELGAAQGSADDRPRAALRSLVAERLERSLQARPDPRRAAAFADARDRDRAREPGRAFVALYRRAGLEAWAARNRRGLRVVDDPAGRFILAVRPTAEGLILKAQSLELFIEQVAARPRVEALATIGAAPRLSWCEDAPPAGSRLGPAPLDRLALAIEGLDSAAFVAERRRRFALGVGLAAAATLAVGLAAFAIARAARREVAAARERASFVAAVTHELKSPIAAIQLLGEILSRGALEEVRARGFAGKIVGEARRLARLVDSVLEWSRLGHGGAVRELLDPAALAREAAEDLRLTAEDKGFVITVELAPGCPPVRGDAAALRRVLVNLLENAFKYSDRGHELRLRVDPAGPHRVRLAVLDRGRGVPPAERGRIFEAFRRGEDSVRGRPGVGLGLALAARTAREHGGALIHEDREGGGSCFSLELPAAEEA